MCHYDPEGNAVLCQYIVELEKIQSSEGLTVATKLKSQHINFKTQKIKVKYATQVFSDSVADALPFVLSYIRYSHSLNLVRLPSNFLKNLTNCSTF